MSNQWRKIRTGSGRNNNDWQPRPGTIKVAVETMPACCTQMWYRHFGQGTLPDEGTLTCACRATVAINEKGWWHRVGSKPQRMDSFTSYNDEL